MIGPNIAEACLDVTTTPNFAGWTRVPQLSPTVKPDSTKEWARPARPTAFIIPIPSKHAAFTLQRCTFCFPYFFCCYGNADAEANTIFVKLTTGDATSIRTWARGARRQRARRRTTWTRRSLLTDRVASQCPPWLGDPSPVRIPSGPISYLHHTPPHHITHPYPEPPLRPVSHPILPVPLHCLPPHVPPLLWIVSPDTTSHLPLPPTCASFSSPPSLLPAALALPFPVVCVYYVAPPVPVPVLLLPPPAVFLRCIRLCSTSHRLRVASRVRLTSSRFVLSSCPSSWGPAPPMIDSACLALFVP
ncbi:hypothetical protein C8R44DRAFT_888119 [Mycena epipterygia]|nr:hypothetical protein C8R44DRAFT_888119 [Mycena epipterygia]